MPSSASALVPSITASHPGLDTLMWMWLKLPAATPVVALYAEKFTCQGRSVAMRVNMTPSGLVQLVKLTAARAPIRVPDSPLPLLSVPLKREDMHEKAEPVLVSLTVSVPEVRESGPPGRTVQVVAARAAVTPSVTAKTAAGTATRLRAYRLVTRCLPPPVGSELGPRPSPALSHHASGATAPGAGPWTPGRPGARSATGRRRSPRSRSSAFMPTSGSSRADGEGQRQHARRARLAQQPGRYGHRPAGLDPVVDQQHRRAERGGRVGDGRGDGQLVPQRAKPLGAVVLQRGRPAWPLAVGVLERAQVRHPADPGDLPAEALDELRPGPGRQRDHAGRPVRPVPGGEDLDHGLDYVAGQRAVGRVTAEQGAQPGPPAEVGRPPPRPAPLGRRRGRDLPRDRDAQLRHPGGPHLPRRHLHPRAEQPVAGGRRGGRGDLQRPVPAGAVVAPAAA